MKQITHPSGRSGFLGLVNARPLRFVLAFVTSLVASTLTMSATTLIDEDFSGGAGDFTSLLSGTWSVSSGEYVLSSPGSSAPNKKLSNLSVHDTAVTDSDWEVSAVVNISGTGGNWDGASLVFNLQDDENFYHFAVCESDNGTHSGVYKLVNNTATEVVNVSTTISTDTDITLKVERNGSSIVCYINGTQVASGTDSTFSGGKVGLGTQFNAATFDDLLVIENSTVSVTGVSVSPSTLTLDPSQTSDLTETVSPGNATDTSVSWSSNNISVATVNSSGLVTAVAPGDATITVTTTDGSYTDTCAVTVNDPGSTVIDEDFSSGASNFTEVSGGTWSVSSGRLILSSPANGGTALLGNIMVCDTVVSGNEYKVTATIQAVSNGGSVWDDTALVFGFQDDDNFYYAILNESDDESNTNGVFKVVSGSPTLLADFSSTYASGTDYDVEVTRSGSSIVLKVDGTQVASFSDATFTGGQFGFGTKNDSGEYDDLLVVVFDTGAPSVPTGLGSSNVTTSSVDLSWNASTDDLGVVGYKVYTNGSNPVSVTGTSTTISGLTQNTSYTFTVSAYDQVPNESSQSSGLNVTTADGQAPSVPTGLTSSNVTSSTVDLDWNASSDNVGVSGYKLYTDGSNPVDVGNVTGVTVTGLSASTSYAFTVSAYDAASNESSQSSAENVTTSSSGGSVAINEDFTSGAGNFSVELGSGTWTATGGRYVLSNHSGGGTALLGNISIHDTEVTASVWEVSVIGSVVGTTSAWNDFALVFNYQDSSNYYYAIVNETNDTNTHGIFKVVSGVGSELADFGSANTITSDTDYTLKVARNGSSIIAYIDGVQVASTTDSNFTDGYVGVGTKNDSAEFDNLLVTTGGFTDAQAPSVPTGLSSSNVGSNSVDLDWNASTDNVAVTGYNLYTNGSNPVGVVSNSITVTGLTASTSYTFTVSAKDGAGNESSESSGVNVTTSSQMSQVADPSFSPGAGSYTSSQNVTISTTTSGATIRYTTDGSTPTSTTGTIYSSAVSVSSSTTLKAIAYKSGMSDSNVVTASYTITTSSATTTTLGELTPSTAQPVPVPGASNGTYGPFSVSNGMATWSSLSSQSGTYTIGNHTIKVVAGHATIAHYLDIPVAYSWGVKVEPDLEACGRSLGNPAKGTKPDITQNLPTNVTWDSGTKTLTIESDFTGALSNFELIDGRIVIEPGNTGLTKISDFYWELTTAYKDVDANGGWIIIQRDYNSSTTSDLPLLENGTMIQPFDFGYPGAVIKPITGSGVNSTFGTARKIYCPRFGGDFLKPQAEVGRPTRVEQCVLGHGGATNGRFEGDWSSSATYAKDEYVKARSGKGFHVSKINNNTSALPPLDGNGNDTSDANWQYRDPHSDTFQAGVIADDLILEDTLVVQRKTDVDGTGQYFSGVGFVNVIRHSTGSSANTSGGHTEVLNCAIFREPAQANRPFYIHAPSASVWPEGAIFRDSIIEARSGGSDPKYDNNGNYIQRTIESFVEEISGCVDAATGSLIEEKP